VSHRISIIIPTYQHAQTIGACIESVLKQTLEPFEIIVVNDGSTDDTVHVLEPYAKRITILSQTNQGSNLARNNGFEVSTGDLVLFCDADVVMRADMLERLADALDGHLEASYAYSGFRFGWKAFRSFPFSAERLKKMNFIHTSALIRRKDFPGFDPAIRRFQDWDVWLTMLEQGKEGVFVDEELFRVENANGRVGISQWRQSFMYRIPWHMLGLMPVAMHSYEQARRIILKKHGLWSPSSR